MDYLLGAATADGKFLGLDWGFWGVLGLTGNVVFGSRFFVQWWATERHKRVVVPDAFWWLSMAGSGCLLAYGISRRDSVFIFAYVFTWIPYVRNLVIGHRVKRAQTPCAACGAAGPPGAKYCHHCGLKLELAAVPA